jgi:hypothetical protein
MVCLLERLGLGHDWHAAATILTELNGNIMVSRMLSVSNVLALFMEGHPTSVGG